MLFFLFALVQIHTHTREPTLLPETEILKHSKKKSCFDIFFFDVFLFRGEQIEILEMKVSRYGFKVLHENPWVHEILETRI